MPEIRAHGAHCKVNQLKYLLSFFQVTPFLLRMIRQVLEKTLKLWQKFCSILSSKVVSESANGSSEIFQNDVHENIFLFPDWNFRQRSSTHGGTVIMGSLGSTVLTPWRWPRRFQLATIPSFSCLSWFCSTHGHFQGSLQNTLPSLELLLRLCPGLLMIPLRK